jgi:alanyl-tRNA synthetase
MPAINGRGGGRPQMAQGRGDRQQGVAEALAAIEDAVRAETAEPGTSPHQDV